jgi:hypothetical protein
VQGFQPSKAHSSISKQYIFLLSKFFWGVTFAHLDMDPDTHADADPQHLFFVIQNPHQLYCILMEVLLRHFSYSQQEILCVQPRIKKLLLQELKIKHN